MSTCVSSCFFAFLRGGASPWHFGFKEIHRPRPVARGGSRGFGRTPLVGKQNLFLTRQQQYRLQSFNCAVVLLQTAYKPSCSCYKG